MGPGNRRTGSGTPPGIVRRSGLIGLEGVLVAGVTAVRAGEYLERFCPWLIQDLQVRLVSGAIGNIGVIEK